MEYIAIVGMGVAGVGVLNAYRALLSSDQLKNVTFHCFDEKDSFGRGLPFRDPSKEALLNSKTDSLNIHLQNPKDTRYSFETWLSKRQDTIPTYETRYAFGSYMKAYLNGLLPELPVKCYYDKVRQIQPQDEKWSLELESLETKLPLYDRVHVCTGEMPNPDFYELDASPRFIKTVYPLVDLPCKIRSSDTALVIGLGLTAIDVAKCLLNTHQLNQVYLFSRSNQFPLVRGDEDESLEFKYLTKEVALKESHPTFEWVEKLLNQELALHSLNYETFLENCYLPGLKGLKASIAHSKEVGLMTQMFSQLVREVLSTAWPLMSERDRQQFKLKYDQVISYVRNPMPKISAQALLDFSERGHLKVLTDVKTINHTDEEKLAVHFNDGTNEVVDWVFNAVGMSLTHETALESGFLATQLLNDRLATLDFQGGLSVASPFYQSLSPRLGETKGLHLHGLLIDGCMYQNNSIINIQQQAFELVESLYKR